MIKNIISKELIAVYEPSLIKYFDDTRINLAINESLSEIINILKNENKKIRLYCVPLVLVDLQNVNNYSSDFIHDEIERLAIVIEYKNAVSINLTLSGSNDLSKLETLKSYQLNGTAQIQDYLIETYAYYKVNLSGSSLGSIKMYLIERSYYKAQLYKAIEILIRGLSVSQSDSWFEKAEFYSKEFAKEVENMLLTYDADEDGVPETFTKSSINQVNLYR